MNDLPESDDEPSREGLGSMVNIALAAQGGRPTFTTHELAKSALPLVLKLKILSFLGIAVGTIWVIYESEPAWQSNQTETSDRMQEIEYFEIPTEASSPPALPSPTSRAAVETNRGTQDAPSDPPPPSKRPSPPGGISVTAGN